MFRKTVFTILLIFCFNYLNTHVYGWGFWAHKRINRMAIFSLPVEMFGFYKYYIDYITEHAVDPDKRRYAVEGEAACHYIDLDRFGMSPFDSIPRKWTDAVDKYTLDTLIAHGIVPWHIERMFYRLTNAFEKNDQQLILKYSADIGHYIGDAHVPLHCTENYNGQLTNQQGIHGFWESRIPELFGDEFDYLTGSCMYIADPLEQAWKIVEASYSMHDSVLTLEKKLNDEFPADRKYAIEHKGTVSMKVYSLEYSNAYNNLLNDMVERRMRSAINMIASFWYTAWVNAGQPYLNFKNKYIFVTDPVTDSIPEYNLNKIINIKGHID